MSEPTPIGDVLGNLPPALAEAWQRLEWADSDGEAIEKIGKGFGEPGTYGVRTEFNGDRWQASFHRLIEPADERAIFAELSRALGSFLDHSRAALNYVAYQLALLALRENPALQGDLNPDSVEYPIFRDPCEFRQKNRIKKLPEKYRDAIETKQPYDRRDQGLWILHELAREFRHRILHPMAIMPNEERYYVLWDGIPAMVDDLEIVPHDRLEDGDVVMRFKLATINPKANVQAQVAMTVGIDHPLCGSRPCTSILNDITAMVGATIIELGAFFPTESP